MHTPLLVGQSLELSRSPLRAAVEHRDPAPLLARARRQLGAGADALDLNAGSVLDGDDLAWAAAALRAAHPSLELWLDCADGERLAVALRDVPPPVVANAAFLGTPAAARVIEAATRVGAGLVVSPAFLDGADEPLPADRLLDASIEAIAAAQHLSNASLSSMYVDCLAYPPASDHARTRRSLALLQLLGAQRPPLAGLAAVGNVGHGAPPGLRPVLRALYAAAAVGAGAAALILPAEEHATTAAVAVAAGSREPHDALERWLGKVAVAAAEGTPLPPPSGAAQRLAPRTLDAWSLLAHRSRATPDTPR